MRSTITCDTIHIHLKGTGCDTVFGIRLFEELREFLIVVIEASCEAVTSVLL